MKKLRLLVLCAVFLGSLIVPVPSAQAQYCQPDDFDVNCRAQQVCKKLADKSPLVSCTQ